MTEMILQNNSKIVYRSIYWQLTIEEMADVYIQTDMQSVKETTEDCLSTELVHKELEDVSILDNPEYLLYSDKDQNNWKYPSLNEENELVLSM